MLKPGHHHLKHCHKPLGNVVLIHEIQGKIFIRQGVVMNYYWLWPLIIQQKVVNGRHRLQVLAVSEKKT